MSFNDQQVAEPGIPSAAVSGENGCNPEAISAGTPDLETDSPDETAELLDELTSLSRKFVVMQDEQAVAVALWVLHTHVFDAADQTPYLSITSAEKRSGKTRLLEVLRLLVWKPWFTGHATAAVLARKIDTIHPTLLFDESDATFKGNPEFVQTFRGVLWTGSGVSLSKWYFGAPGQRGRNLQPGVRRT
jgi:hypothetical protein